MEQLMEITSPFGDAVRFETMQAREELGRLAEYDITVLSAKETLLPKDILGQSVTVIHNGLEAGPRHFNACVTRFGLVGVEGRYFRYRIVAHTWLWLLTRSADCRIFQNKSVPDIVREIFGKYADASFDFRLTGSYAPLEYCVQYRESDFDFVSRLLETEGIYYFLKHAPGKHTVVLCDSISAHKPVVGHPSIRFLPEGGRGRAENKTIGQWMSAREIRTGMTELDDYDFERPSLDLKKSSKVSSSDGGAKFEVYDYPGDYLRTADGERYVKTRLEALRIPYEVMEGRSGVVEIASGATFTLQEHPRDDQNREYLVVSAEYDMVHGGHETGTGQGSSHSCRFTAMPTAEVFRPERRTPRAIVRGPQTAVVVGPAGEEIYTDKYGRVKVQFHWDRLGRKDENASCWVRVSHPWAGKNWGMVALPRIGQEVIVDFLEGNPDRPIITGRVYNAEQMPPYALPANMTQTGIKTRSSKGGSPANFNELRFEDKKGEEQVYVHAERNFDGVIENCETRSIGVDRSKSVGHDETVSVGHDRSESVQNNESISIGVNRDLAVGADASTSVGSNRSITVGSNESHDVGGRRNRRVGGDEHVDIGANLTETIGKNVTLSIGENQSVTVGKDGRVQLGKSYYLEAADAITFKTGDASITLKKDGTITIQGRDIAIKGSGKVSVKASGEVAIKGMKIASN